MIDKENITQLLNKLDEALVKKSLHRQITIFGSGALILQGVASSHRATVDNEYSDTKQRIEEVYRKVLSQGNKNEN